MERIGHNAFGDFRKLKSVKFPKTLRRIDAYAFSGCQSLNKIVIKSKKLKKIGPLAFETIGHNAVIYVPQEKEQEYREMLRSAAPAVQIIAQ